MIITILNQPGLCGSYGLASYLALLRAHTGRDVQLVYVNTLAAAKASENAWETIEIKLGAIAHPMISDQHLDTTLQNPTAHYDDIVVDADTRDSVGNRSALKATDVAVIPIQPDDFGATICDTLIQRIGDARVTNPALRVLVVMCMTDDQSLQGIEAARRFVTTIRAAVLVDSSEYGRTVVHEMPSEIARKPLNGEQKNPAMSRLYRSVFVAD